MFTAIGRERFDAEGDWIGAGADVTRRGVRMGGDEPRHLAVDHRGAPVLLATALGTSYGPGSE